MWQSWLVLLLATVCLAQRQQPSSPSGDRQIRLEDIERDNLAASQKPGTPVPSSASANVQQSPSPHQAVTQQQLAAYQQQLLLQQLQQQYFTPTPITYGNFGGVPLMIIHSNHLGVGGPANLPIQAYFVPEPQYVPPYNPALYQPVPRYTQSRPVDLTYNSLALPRQHQTYPSASIVYAGTPLAPSPNFQQPQNTQSIYNAYNTLYHQRSEKNALPAGEKSTSAPPVKSQSPAYTSQQLNTPALYTTNYKNFNYNQ